MSDLFVDITLPTGETYKQPIGLYINGEWVKTDEQLETIDPSTEKVITSVYLANEKHVDLAVKAAKTAFKFWKTTTGTEKAVLLNKLADLTEANIDILASIEALDTGKPKEYNAKADIQNVADILRYYAGWADKIQGKVIPISENKIAYTLHEPIGVCGQIVPWNYPLSMSGWKIAPALATGNVIVMKSSENTPLSLLYFAQLITNAGFPPGVVNFLSGTGAVAGNAISSHPLVDKVAFTGSTKVGAIIQQTASINLKAVTLECGGKSPLVVFEDAEVEQAAKWAAWGIMYNSGQNCTANSRIYLHEKIHDKFLGLFKKHILEELPLGLPFEENSKLGPVISKVQYDRIKNYIKIGEEEGATVYLGKEKLPFEKGYWIHPTVFTNCTQDMTIVKEEIFGPVVAVSKFSTYDEVIEAANDSNYGLAAMVFTSNIATGHSFARDIESGTVYINSSNDEDIKVPFGGVKMSGVGRELGEYGLSTYTQAKAIHVNLGARL